MTAFICGGRAGERLIGLVAAGGGRWREGGMEESGQRHKLPVAE